MKTLVEIPLIITKADLQPDGSMRWQAVTSDTDPDRTGESTSLELFKDWINRVEKGVTVPFLPPPRRPFLGISHYPSLNGFGEAGITERMFIAGNRFVAEGTFYPGHPVARGLIKAILNDPDLIRRGKVENPIRISAAWWDIAHSHNGRVFERKALTDTCPMCERGIGGKTYLAGQLDHYASTRVPINPRTTLALQEKAAMTTQKDDAASILGDDLAEEMEQRLKKEKAAAFKSETIQTPALVVKADGSVNFYVPQLLDKSGSAPQKSEVKPPANQLPISPITGEPSLNTALIQRSVGIDNGFRLPNVPPAGLMYAIEVQRQAQIQAQRAAYEASLPISSVTGQPSEIAAQVRRQYWLL